MALRFSSAAAAAALAAVLALPATSLALDFGPLSVTNASSAFEARLSVLNLSVAEAAAMNPHVADAFVWRAKGIVPEPWVKTLHMMALPAVNGRSVVAMSGKTAPAGHHRLLLAVAGSIREYVIEGGKTGVIYPQPIASTAAGRTLVTRRGDTLSDLAASHRYRGAWRNQMLVAMFRLNRNAFVGDNMNRLKTGARLRMPSLEQVLAVSRQEATAIVAAHEVGFAQWKNHTGDGAVGIREFDSSRTAAAKGDRLEIARTRDSARDRAELDRRVAAGIDQKAQEVADQNAKLRALVLEEKAKAAGTAGAMAASEDVAKGREAGAKSAHDAQAAKAKDSAEMGVVKVDRNSAVMKAIGEGAAAKAGQGAKAEPGALGNVAKNYWWVALLVLLLGGLYLWRRNAAQERDRKRDAEAKIVADVDKMLSGVNLDLDEPVLDNAARLARAAELADAGHREEATKLAQFVLEGGTPDEQAKAAAFLNRIGA